MSQNLIEHYQALVASGAIQSDDRQRFAAVALQRLSQRLRRHHPHSLFGAAKHALTGQVAAPHGIYLHGPVGSGKTMLMDLFFASAPGDLKRRLHFDAFMAHAHAAIAAQRAHAQGDPMAGAAKALANEAELLCLDEFQVNDIADATIVSRLFAALFAEGLVLVATSNTAPRDLYRDGLNRSLFTPFIELLLAHVDVIEVAADHDYRLDKLAGNPLYFAPADAEAGSRLDAAWQLLTGNGQPKSRSLTISGHKLTLPRTCGGVLRATFTELCEQPLGAADYRAIAEVFHTVILEGIPVMGPAHRNEARRFITLIDALYDTHTGLIASAQAEPDALYTAGDGSQAFGRTASRLIEMRSQDYLKARRSGQRSVGLPAVPAQD